jgi:hypothetical protein
VLPEPPIRLRFLEINYENLPRPLETRTENYDIAFIGNIETADFSSPHGRLTVNDDLPFSQTANASTSGSSLCFLLTNREDRY